MRDAYPEIQNTGARLLVIGNGSPAQAARFKEEYNIPFELWVDPKLEAYKAAGMKRGLLASASIRSVGHLARARKAGFRQGPTRGDAWQNGGAFVIDHKGSIIFEQVSRESGDHAPLDELIGAAAAANR